MPVKYKHHCPKCGTGHFHRKTPLPYELCMSCTEKMSQPQKDKWKSFSFRLTTALSENGVDKPLTAFQDISLLIRDLISQPTSASPLCPFCKGTGVMRRIRIDPRSKKAKEILECSDCGYGEVISIISEDEESGPWQSQ